ncbi:DUF4397 domain-containing protein [Marinobacter panjinensis]|uniref:DUF4397 domain-containing protein n=1 Tax=Marinobacter panjinensis TaxID=2576384 RepID=A0A4U6QT92_9GAMM|nr:DUF4397 domain-containing protein [Marinobacter panjinensis]MCR8914985.1 DUF4397 domain-containing protein [Marinobacter panjinensis]TKV64224.1 DUF4397 domain-containing protein [Marinobacter panjinensis]
MTSKYALPVAVAGSIVLAGCFDSSSSSSDPAPITTQVRVIHGVSDAPAVNVGIDGDVAIAGADFKQAAILNPAVGSYSVTVDGLLPGSETVTVIGPADLTFEEGISYDIIASGSVGADTVAPILLSDNGERSNPDSVRLRVAHLSPAAQQAAGGAVDVYLTPASAGDALPADPNFSFSFGDDVGPLEVGADTYRIRVTPENSDVVVYDSGGVPLASGADLLIGAVDNTVFGDSPVSLLVVDGGETLELLDVDTGAGLRAAHNSSDAGEVDVYLNTEPDGTSAAVTALAFGETVPSVASTGSYVGLDVGDNRLAITATGGTDAVIDETIDFANGQLLTILAAGSINTEIEPLVFPDDNRRIATAAKLRVIHGAVEAPVVDVYLLPTVDTGAGDTMIGNAEPALPDFAYGKSSGYLQVAADDYVVVITDTDGNELFKSGSLTLEAGGVYGAVARLNPEPASTATVTLLDDFVQAQN